MKRHLLGIIALALILPGLAGVFLGYSGQSPSAMATAVGLRVGLVLGAFWMAFPQLAQMVQAVPGWLLGTLALGVLVVAIRPQLLSFVLVVVAVLVGLQFVGRLLKPAEKHSVRRRKDPSHSPPARQGK